MGIFSTDEFHYCHKTKRFSQELSHFNGRKVFGPVDLDLDTLDVGFYLRSARTGELAAYYVEESKYDMEGELQFYCLAPTLETMRNLPGTRGTRIILFND